MEDILQNMSDIDLEKYLDYEIGFWWWKKYVTTAFWSNFSTPLNLSITVLTAVTTGQSATNTYVYNNVFMIINILTLVLTTLNSFFRPFEQYKSNLEFMQRWQELGCNFETIYITYKEEDKFVEYKKIKEKIDVLKKEQETSRNFIADLIHLVLQYSYLKEKQQWLDVYKKYRKDKDQSTQQKRFVDLKSIINHDSKIHDEENNNEEYSV